VPLEEYRRKRDVRRTPEPIPAADPTRSAGRGDRFVIQEHHARSLHWDVRLERDGVLVSFAVPKGLPAEPGTVRLAVHTEDHPLEYLEFAGEIPAGEYGGGRMMIWDAGRYDTEKWTEREVAVVLHGERARGRYVFVRSDRDGREGWLLRRSDPAAADHEPLPHDARPMEPTPGPLPEDPGWWQQVCFGGRRVVVRVEGGRAEVHDSDGADLTGDLPRLRELGPALGATQVLLDGELTDTPLRMADLWIGDLLHLDGRDTTSLPFTERRGLLEGLPLTGAHWRVAPVFPDAGQAVLAAAREQGLPAIVAIIAAVLVLLAGIPSHGYGLGRRF